MGIELEVACDSYDYDKIFSYSIWYEYVEDFAMDHAIFNEDDLNEITPEHLIKRFEKGEARIFCQVGNDQYLFFQREDVLMYAKDSFDEEHMVCKLLVEKEDYIDYTKAYYKKYFV